MSTSGTHQKLTIKEPCILVRISRLYRPGITPQELYHATRGIWRVGPRRNRARYALAMFSAVVLEVYEIHAWHQAGTTPYPTRTLPPELIDGRWEFVGAVEPRLSAKYVNGSVGIPKGCQAPILYVNC